MSEKKNGQKITRCFSITCATSRIVALLVILSMVSMPLAAFQLPKDLKEEENSTREVVEKRKALFTRAREIAEEKIVLPLDSS
mgnify:CR=1 FL=1